MPKDANDSNTGHRFVAGGCWYCGLERVVWLADPNRPTCPGALPVGTLAPPRTPGERDELDTAWQEMADLLNDAFDCDPSRLAAGMRAKLAGAA